MSENTNTLFWVITGAVIVLAVFLLINSAQDNTLSNISGTFTGAWEEQINNSSSDEEDDSSKVVYSESYLRNSNKFYCRANGAIAEKDGIKVEITQLQTYDNGNMGINWSVINNGDRYQERLYLSIYIFDCSNNSKIYEINYPISLNPGESHRLQTSGSAPRGDWQYYIDLDYKYY